MERIKYETPQVYRAICDLQRIISSIGSTGATVITTEDMSEEEEEMALFEGFLKEGYPPQIAEKKAKEWVQKMKAIS